MGMSEDLHTMQRYADAGLLKEHMEGTAPRLPPEPTPAAFGENLTPERFRPATRKQTYWPPR